LIQDQETLRRSIQEIFASSPEQVETYLSGKEGVSQWFFGQVMRVTGGRAAPGVVQQLLDEELEDLKSRQSEDSAEG
jgi:glutaminyl-tRNA synthetase